MGEGLLHTQGGHRGVAPRGKHCRAAEGRRRPDPRRAAADRRRARRPGAGAARRGGRRRPGGRDRAAHRHRLRPRRDGGQARRARGARRAARRVPADRGAPAAGRVLRRHRRGDPRIQGRRPALGGTGRARPVGAALPRTAAHPVGPGPRQGARGQAPGRLRDPRQDRRRDHRRGHGGVLLGPRRPDGPAARPPAARRRGARLRPRADPDPGDRAGRDQPGVPGGVLGERRLRRRGAGRPRRLGLPADREDPRDGGRARHRLVDARAVRCHGRRRGGGERRGPLAEELAAESKPLTFGITIDAAPATAYRGETSRMLADVRQWLAEGWRVVLVTEGHGPAKRLAEVLRGEGFGARVGDLDAEPGGRRALRGDRGAAPGVLLAGRAARGAHRGGLRRARHRAAELAGRAADAVRAAARRG